MPERFTKAERSRIMAAVKSRDTTPEMIARRLVHKLGYRFRLHNRTLPGTPDIVLNRHKKIINVHGCFWHMHSCQRKRKDPVHDAKYWTAKRLGNATRDRRNLRKLKSAGWKVLTIWECQTTDSPNLRKKILAFLRHPKRPQPK